MEISESVHSEHSEKLGANQSSQVTINEPIVPENTLQENRTSLQTQISLPGQEKSLLSVPDVLITEKTDSDMKLEEVYEDKLDAHIDTIKMPTKESISENTSEVFEAWSLKLGLFKYAPSWARNIFLTPAGILFFLCWASTMQVTKDYKHSIINLHLNIIVIES